MGKAKINTGAHRGELEKETETGTQFFFLEGAESEGVVAADSIMARDLLEVFDDLSQKHGGTITLPLHLNNWKHGNIKSALGAY